MTTLSGQRTDDICDSFWVYENPRRILATLDGGNYTVLDDSRKISQELKVIITSEGEFKIPLSSKSVEKVELYSLLRFTHIH